MSVKLDAYRLYRMNQKATKLRKQLSDLEKGTEKAIGSKELEARLFEALADGEHIVIKGLDLVWSHGERKSTAWSKAIDQIKVKFEDDPDVLAYIERKVAELTTVRVHGKLKEA